ncbi:Abi family protein [Salinibacterium sp. PAMC 21357]|uniref:Abi family protein n=1 Tax=Salinibacterium sp. PAMC 21357 TaxID=1112215 RepID=UPI00028991BE|nr:Abi family protein [Salinibacterium sp. PAMC 21357]
MSKVSLSIAGQREQLLELGLLDSNGSLEHALYDHGYFRLSGYFRYFQIDPKKGRNGFAHGADFSEIYEIYKMDAKLRNLLLEGLAEVEVALRSVLTTVLCQPGKPGNEYLVESTYEHRFNKKGDDLRAILLSDIDKDIKRSKEPHVVHYRQGPTDVPLWVATEALSFGAVSRIHSLLASKNRADAIAGRFKYDGGITRNFASNMRATVVFRNLCAHHGRLWNRQFTEVAPTAFSGLHEQGLVAYNYTETAWGFIAVLNHMVAAVRGDNTFKQKIDSLVPRSGAYWDGLVSPNAT